MFHQVRLKSGESGASVSAASHLKVKHLKREGTLLLGHLLGACSASLCHSSFTHLFEQHPPDDLHMIFNISRTFPCTLDSKGRMVSPKLMNFRKSSKRPLTPPPHFRKIMLRFSQQNCDKSAYVPYGGTVIT